MVVRNISISKNNIMYRRQFAAAALSGVADNNWLGTATAFYDGHAEFGRKDEIVNESNLEGSAHYIMFAERTDDPTWG